MKAIIISILAAGALISGAYLLNQSSQAPREDNPVPANNVSVVDGKQIVVIKAKGGYQPRRSVAQAGIPTVLRFDTDGTFDCSAAVRIPSLNITQMLPQSGKTDIEIGNPQVGTLQGSCGMGMYPFEVVFN